MVSSVDFEPIRTRVARLRDSTDGSGWRHRLDRRGAVRPSSRKLQVRQNSQKSDAESVLVLQRDHRVIEGQIFIFEVF